MKKHIYVKRQQYACYNKLKEELGENEILLHVDYSENYSNIQQGEMRCAYFGHDSFSIFTACCYLCKECDLINENISIISEAKDHSRIAAFIFISKVFDFGRKSMIYHQKLPYTFGVTALQANPDHDMFLLWFLK